MSTLGFDKYVDPLKIYLAKYRESVKLEKRIIFIADYTRLLYYRTDSYSCNSRLEGVGCVLCTRRMIVYTYRRDADLEEIQKEKGREGVLIWGTWYVTEQNVDGVFFFDSN